MSPGKFWNEIEGYEWKEVVKIQEKRLQEQLAYVKSHSEFYQKKLADIDLSKIRRVEDLKYIPFTHKEEIRQSLKENPPYGSMVAVSPEKILQIQASSGTTGTPTYYFLTQSDVDAWNEILARVYYAGGIVPGDKYFHAFSMSKGFVGGLPMLQAFLAMNVTVIPMGAESGTERILASMKYLQPDALGCTPYFALYIAENVPRILGVKPAELTIRKLLVGGEPGGGIPTVRRQLEELWGAKVNEVMGGADLAPAFWSECEDQSGMHFVAHEYIIPEIIDPKTGEALEIQEGVEGELVYTAIRREASPLVRFRMRDNVTVTGTDCKCGRKSLKIRCFGRTDDMLIVKGVNVFPSAIQDLVSSFQPRTTGAMEILADFDGHTTQRPLKLKVEYGEHVTQGEIEKLRSDLVIKIKELLVFSPDIEMAPVNSIERPKESKVSLIKRIKTK
jgi:phenylacetate-CoA ligase